MNRVFIYFLATVFLFVFGCDSSGDNGPPDSVQGTWEGEMTVQMDTVAQDAFDQEWHIIGSVTRQVEAVITGEKGDLAVTLEVRDEGQYTLGEGGSGIQIDEVVATETDGQYGSPNLLIDNPPHSGFNWRFEVGGKDKARGEVTIDLDRRSCTQCSWNAFVKALAAKEETLVLERQ